MAHYSSYLRFEFTISRMNSLAYFSEWILFVCGDTFIKLPWDPTPWDVMLALYDCALVEWTMVGSVKRHRYD